MTTPVSSLIINDALYEYHFPDRKDFISKQICSFYTFLFSGYPCKQKFAMDPVTGNLRISSNQSLDPRGNGSYPSLFF